MIGSLVSLLTIVMLRTTIAKVSSKFVGFPSNAMRNNYTWSSNRADMKSFLHWLRTTTNDSASDSDSTVTNILDNKIKCDINDKIRLNESDYYAHKYPNRVICIYPEKYPQCEMILCGTVHVSNQSSEMVSDVIKNLRPDYVVLELCEERIDSLVEDDKNESIQNITLKEIIKESWASKSLKSLGTGILTWLQIQAAKMTNSKLGGELSTACKEAYRCQATIILGDRPYSITMQRIFDKLKFTEKLKLIFTMTMEVITMNVVSVKEFVQKSQQDDNFIQDEIEQFNNVMPSFANVVVYERDEYLAETILELARVSRTYKKNPTRKHRIVAVVGAGHLQGIRKHILAENITSERIKEISSSSKHKSCWPEAGMFHTVNGNLLYEKPLTSN